MQYTEGEINKIYQLLLSEDEINSLLALQLLSSEDLKEEIMVALLWLSYYSSNQLSTKILTFTKERLTPEKYESIYLALQLFYVVHDAYRFHSEHTYNTTEEKLCVILKNYPYIQDSVKNLIKQESKFQLEFSQIAQTLWTYYRLPEAESFLLQLIDIQPSTSVNYFYLGQLYQHAATQQYDLAITYYQKYIQLEPTILFDNDFIIDEWFVNYRNYPPSTVEALIEIGNIYFRTLKNYSLAKKYYQQAIDLQPITHIAPYESLAEILENQDNNSRKALDLRLKIYEIKAQSSIFRYKRADLINFSDCIFRLGINYLNNFKDAKQAMICYKKALNLQPNNINIMLKQAELAIESYKDYWQARTLYEKILKIQPTQEEAKRKLQKIRDFIQGK